LLENALHHTRANAELPADLEHPVTARLQFENSRLDGGINATPAELGPTTSTLCGLRARRQRENSAMP